MTIDVRPIAKDPLADLFNSLRSAFRHLNANIAPTSGSYSAISRETEATIDSKIMAGTDPAVQVTPFPRFAVGTADMFVVHSPPSVQITTDTPSTTADYEMAQLESAAAVGDEQAFLASHMAIDWQSRSAEDLIRAVRLALAAGAFMAARNLSAEGAARYLGNAELAKYARVLAPPQVTVAHRPPDTSWRANREWLQAHRSKYRGQWVALRNGELLATAKSGRELFTEITDREGILITTVF